MHPPPPPSAPRRARAPRVRCYISLWGGGGCTHSSRNVVDPRADKKSCSVPLLLYTLVLRARSLNTMPLHLCVCDITAAAAAPRCKAKYCEINELRVFEWPCALLKRPLFSSCVIFTQFVVVAVESKTVFFFKDSFFVIYSWHERGFFRRV